MHDNEFEDLDSSGPWEGDWARAEEPEPGELPEFSGGEDWLEFTGRLRYRDWKLLHQVLTDKKTAALDGGPECAVLDVMHDEPTITVDGYGKTLAGSAAFHAPFVLRSDGIALALMPFGIEEKIGWNYKVTIPSLPLIQIGIYGCVDQLLAMMKAIGAQMESATVGRVDLAIDLPGQSVAPFVQAHREKRYAGCRRGGGEIFNCTRQYDDGTNDTGLSVWDEQDTGYRVTAGVLIRIYDKLREMQVKHDEQKLLAMKLNRYNGNNPEHATRIEFQLRPNFLRTAGVQTLEDWFARRADIAKYLTEEYLRMADKPVDRKNRHQHRAQTDELWQKVQRAFTAIYGEGRKMKRVYRKGEPNVSALHKQLVGCLLSSAAKRGVRLDSKAAAIRELEFALANYGNDRLDSESLRRVIKLYRGTGFGIGDNLAG